MKKCLAGLLILAMLTGGAAFAQGVEPFPEEMNRGILYGLISQTASDLNQTISVQQCMTLLGNVIFELGGSVGIWDALTERAGDAPVTRLEYALMLERAAQAAGVSWNAAFSADELAAFEGVSEDFTIFGVAAEPFRSEELGEFVSEWQYAMGFVTHTFSAESGLAILPMDATNVEALRTELTWQEAVAGAVRLYEAASPGQTTQEPEEEPGAIPVVAQTEKWPAAPPAGEYGYTIVVTNDNVNIRETPDNNAKVLDRANRGMRLWCDGGIADWYRIRDAERNAAYISTKFAVAETEETAAVIQPEQPAQAQNQSPADEAAPEGVTPVGEAWILKIVNTESVVNLRATPGTDGKIVGTAALGTRFVCLGEAGGWYQVSDNAGGACFVSGDFCQRDEAADAVSRYPRVQGVVVTTAKANLRATPSAKGVLLEKAAPGKRFGYVEKVGENWYKVLYSGDLVGFVSASSVREE